MHGPIVPPAVLPTSSSSRSHAQRVAVARHSEEAKKLVSRANVLFLHALEMAKVAASNKMPGAIATPRGLVEFRTDPTSINYEKNFDPSETVMAYCASCGRKTLAATQWESKEPIGLCSP